MRQATMSRLADFDRVYAACLLLLEHIVMAGKCINHFGLVGNAFLAQSHQNGWRWFAQLILGGYGK
jgi:hypothetical protein